MGNLAAWPSFEFKLKSKTENIYGLLTMHILIVIFLVLSSLAGWYLRLKALNAAARDVGQLAKRAVNAPRKFAFMSRAKKTGIKGVDDPLEAGAILMVLAAGANAGQGLAQEQEKIIKAEACKVFAMDADDAADLIAHAVWMVRDVDLVSGVVLRMTQVLKQSPGIGATELVDLHESLEAVSTAMGEPDAGQGRTLELYRNKVGISV